MVRPESWTKPSGSSAVWVTAENLSWVLETHMNGLNWGWETGPS